MSNLLLGVRWEQSFENGKLVHRVDCTSFADIPTVIGNGLRHYIEVKPSEITGVYSYLEHPSRDDYIPRRLRPVMVAVYTVKCCGTTPESHVDDCPLRVKTGLAAPGTPRQA
jgi:hypothetical protein